MRALGIELTGDELRVVRVERRMGVLRVLACERLPAPTSADRRAALAAVRAWRPHTVATAVPLAALAHRTIELPFRDARRVGETVTLELLGRLPNDPGDVVTGHLTLEVGSSGTRCLAALARRSHVDALSAALDDAGVASDRIDAGLLGVWHLVEPAATADAALVLADGERSAIALRRGGRLVGLRALAVRPADDAGAFAAEVRWALAALGGTPAVVLLGADASPGLGDELARVCDVRTMPLADVVTPGWRVPGIAATAVAAGLIAGAGLVLERRHDRAGDARRARRVAAIAVAATVLAIADVGLVRWHLARRDRALVAAIETTATAALPPGTRLVAPRAQLEAAAGSIAARPATASSVLGLLRELSARLPADVGIELDELRLDGDVLRIHGRADRFETVDVVARALVSSAALRDVAAEDSRAAVDGRGVEFGLRATWRPALGAPS
jgi:Tfp pilus assembly protein PilN